MYFPKTYWYGGETDMAKREHEVDKGVCVFVCVLFFLNIGKTLACLGAGKSHWTCRVKGENGWNEISEDEYGRKRKALSLCCM